MNSNWLFKFRKSPSPQKVKIGEVLLKKKLISSEELEAALLYQKETGKKLGNILIERGVITNSQLEAALNRQYWQNVTATFCVSLGAFATTVPQAAIAQFAPLPRHSQSESTHKFNQHRGGFSRYSTKRSPEYRPVRNLPVKSETNASNYPSTSKLENVSLAANYRPTESNPLHGFLYPFNTYQTLSQEYNGTTHRGRMRYARDMAAAIGTPIFAMRSGVVVGVEDRFPDTGGGPENMTKFNYVWIEHDGGYRSAYLHLKQGFTSSINIKIGDRVRAGQAIGLTGNSGWSSGPHLHVEVHKYENNGTFGQTVPFNLTMWSSSRVARQ
jgi:murein DD-endopeptidase MepM/ murein hydrolase activator NlpD